MVKYKIMEDETVLVEGQTIKQLLSQWMSMEIAYINNQIADGLETSVNTEEIGYDVIKRLKAYRTKLKDNEGQKQFDDILNILDGWEVYASLGLDIYCFNPKTQDYDNLTKVKGSGNNGN